MNKAGIIGIIIGIIVVMGIGVLISNYNQAVKLEEQISALHKDSENVLAQFSLKVVEASGVAKAYRNDLVAVTKEAMQGRYGADGSGAAWQWIKEQNPTVDPSIRIKIAQIVDGGRSNFENSQRIKLDACKVYKEQLRYAVGGTIKSIMGFPKLDLGVHCEIVSSEHASDAFKTKIDNGIQGLDN